ncbi:MAG: hypothetical protein EXR29_04655 [Betaproteobacteria bacterium]|nr:hypothetical protein [Betaproteobacteria bacterium]
MNAAWRSFSDEIARWRDSGRVVDFWWRDDDASRRDPALSRLFELAAGADVPLALAVVPDAVDYALFEGAVPGISVLQHGADHRNRAAGVEKKTEFSVREPEDEALRRLASGRAKLESVAGSRTLPVLAPPWNRLAAALVPRLAEAGYCGLSTYGARKAEHPAPGLKQVNTHVDIIDWKAGRGFVGEDHALGQAIGHLAARRTGLADASEPTGWLTHHAVHDEAAWNFLARLLETTRGAASVHWLCSADVFGHRPAP